MIDEINDSNIIKDGRNCDYSVIRYLYYKWNNTVFSKKEVRLVKDTDCKL